MSQAKDLGAERKWISPKEAVGPNPVFPQNAHGDHLSAVTFFATAKNVTAESTIPAPAPQRPPMRVCGRLGTAFTKAAEASAFAPDQTPNGNPLPGTQPQPHSLSIGSGFSKNPDAPASEPLPFPKNAYGNPGSAGAAFAQAKDVTADDSQNPMAPPMPFSKNTHGETIFPGGAFATANGMTGNDAISAPIGPQDEIHQVNRGFQGAPAPLGKERPVSPKTDSPSEDDAWNRARWDEFHGLKKRQWSLIRSFKESDPTNAHLATLQTNVSFKCRCGAKFDTQPTIGYVDGKPNWLGLHKCGSIWACPICGQVRMKKHEDEILTGLVAAGDLEWDVLFYTNTIPHKSADDMLELMEKMKVAKTLFKKGGDISRSLKSKGYMGSIVRLEVTFGVNGIHPHNHTLMFFDHKLSTEEYNEISNSMQSKWKKSCESAGLVSPKNEKNFDKYGFNIERTNDIEKLISYMTKCEKPQKPQQEKKQSGLSKEMTNASDTKKAKNANANGNAPWGRSQWDVMRGFIAGDPFDTNLWLTFLKAFYRKHAIRWSEGLKEKLSVEVDDRSDEQKVKIDEEKKEGIVPIYEVGKYNNVLRHGLWYDIIKSVETKDFSKLEHITNKYHIDFKSVHDEFPSFHSQETKHNNAMHERYLENMKRLKEEEAEAARLIAARNREKAQIERAKRATLAKQNQYSTSLLSKEESRTIATTIKNNRNAAKQKKQDERLRRKNEAKYPVGRRVA